MSSILNINTEITKEEINALPVASFRDFIKVITTQEDAIKAAAVLKKETILGFDTETRPSFKKGEEYKVALLQLCSEKTAYLFRINQFKIPNELIDILTDENIIKTGVAIHDDIKALKKITPFKEKSFIELADLGKQVGINRLGLRSLAAMLLNLRVSKGAKLSNWENKTLERRQILYAATDAWISRELYCVFEFNNIQIQNP